MAVSIARTFPRGEGGGYIDSIDKPPNALTATAGLQYYLEKDVFE